MAAGGTVKIYFIVRMVSDRVASQPRKDSKAPGTIVILDLK